LADALFDWRRREGFIKQPKQQLITIKTTFKLAGALSKLTTE
jgi:hypothetical protein